MIWLDGCVFGKRVMQEKYSFSNNVITVYHVKNMNIITMQYIGIN